MKCYRVQQNLTELEKQELVAGSDLAFEYVLEERAEEIAQTPNLRLLGLTGPTCSGKTTAAKKLTERLQAHGHRVHIISIDDFFYSVAGTRNRTTVDTSREIDYDSEEAVDLEWLGEAAESLLSGKPTQLPRFDFRTGLQGMGEILVPQAEDVFLFEGIQVLYPKVNAILNGPAYRSLYICPEASIETGGEVFLPNEIRLMRRLVRDYRYRASPPQFTFYLWQSVRANEEKLIFPHAHLCGDRIDSTHAYEIGMLKPYLCSLLEEVPADSPYRKSAEEILARLVQVERISSDYMTPNSLYKEFI